MVEAQAIDPRVEAQRLKRIKNRETGEQKTHRHWLTRFMVRALAVDPHLANVPLDKNGWVLGTKLLSAAQGAKDSPKVIFKMETLLKIVAQSQGGFEKKHDKATGLWFRSANRIEEEKKERRTYSKDETQKLIAESKAKAKKDLQKRRKKNEDRAAEAEKRKKASAVKREENRQKRLEASRQRALKDPKNTRRIASPNNPKALARIAPPLKRVGKGATTEDAKQAVTDRKQ